MSEYHVLWQGNDQLGPVSVLDNGEFRVLAFGDNDEQSKQLKSSPHIPQHSYIQAMLMVLMFTTPRSAIVLGLGGGALIHALRHYDASIKLTSVEIRPCVIELAKRYFQLPQSKKLTLIEQDAKDFLEQKNHKRVDIIFADLYHQQGVDEHQLSELFIQNSYAMLKTDGVLVLNCWKEQSVNEAFKALVNHYFVNVYACLTSGGNWVIFAAKKAGVFFEHGLKAKIQDLSVKLDYQVGRSMSRFGEWR